MVPYPPFWSMMMQGMHAYGLCVIWPVSLGHLPEWRRRRRRRRKKKKCWWWWWFIEASKPRPVKIALEPSSSIKPWGTENKNRVRNMAGHTYCTVSTWLEDVKEI
ncbi:hypothetical protein LZ31DRAFT_14733 [Colletotrichum somersetense]|nr:hypothetical protein LZ31DRAFT_14733 [Colletotrichum somersetense]